MALLQRARNASPLFLITALIALGTAPSGSTVRVDKPKNQPETERNNCHCQVAQATRARSQCDNVFIAVLAEFARLLLRHDIDQTRQYLECPQPTFATKQTGHTKFSMNSIEKV